MVEASVDYRWAKLIIMPAIVIGTVGWLLSFTLQAWDFLLLFTVGMAFLLYARVWIERHMAPDA